MAISTLDTTTALIVVDLQKGIVAFPTVHPVADVIDKSAALAEAFRRHGLPVVLVNVTGRPPGRTEQSRHLGDMAADWADIVPALHQQPSDHIVTKQTAGAFTGTGLEALLKASGVTQVVITGIATSMGVESTARQAHELGFNVTLATDAMTDVNADTHANSVARVFPRLGETGTAHEILDRLDATRS